MRRVPKGIVIPLVVLGALFSVFTYMRLSTGGGENEKAPASQAVPEVEKTATPGGFPQSPNGRTPIPEQGIERTATPGGEQQKQNEQSAEDDSLTDLPPQAVPPERQIQVWTYRDEAQQVTSERCMDFLETMVSIADRHTTNKRAMSCTVGAAAFRLRFSQDSAGILYLRRVELLVTLGAQPASTDGRPEGVPCKEWENRLLPASRPANEAVATGVCWQDALPRGHGHEQVMGIWGRVPVLAPVQSFPEDVHCWQLTRYQGGPAGVGSKPV